jgi:hypothetical protein
MIEDRAREILQNCGVSLRHADQQLARKHYSVIRKLNAGIDPWENRKRWFAQTNPNYINTIEKLAKSYVQFYDFVKSNVVLFLTSSDNYLREIAFLIVKEQNDNNRKAD